jgi:hypothetical protein
MLRNEDFIKSQTKDLIMSTFKPDRFSKPVRFGSSVLEVIKSSFLSITD